MARSRDDTLNVWPAFTDTMLAFVLVLVLMISYQVARTVGTQVMTPERKADQSQVEGLVEEYQAEGYQNIDLTTNGIIQNITFGSDVTFQPGSARLKTQGTDLLRGLARTITGAGDTSRLSTLMEIQVSGHTDNVYINTAAYPSNWELSTARATRVIKSMIDAGVDPQEITMSATGYGQFSPRVANTSRQGRKKNRRIEMRLIYSDSVAE